MSDAGAVIRGTEVHIGHVCNARLARVYWRRQQWRMRAASGAVQKRSACA